MDEVTTTLGKSFRDFKTKVCSAYATRELPREMDTRQRRQSKKDCQPKKGRTSKKAEPTSEKKGGLKKEFSLQTYKFHALGDYVKTIREYGTTDSYSSQAVSVVCFLLFFCLILTTAGGTRASQTEGKISPYR